LSSQKKKNFIFFKEENNFLSSSRIKPLRNIFNVYPFNYILSQPLFVVFVGLRPKKIDEFALFFFLFFRPRSRLAAGTSRHPLTRPGLGTRQREGGHGPPTLERGQRKKTKI